jgi:hypothetical protein
LCHASPRYASGVPQGKSLALSQWLVQMSVSVAPSREDQFWPGQVKSDLGRRWPSALGDPLIR